MTDIVEVYCSANEAEARFLVAMLAEHGIEAQVVGELLNGVAGGAIPAGWQASPRIWTTHSDREVAKSLIANWEEDRRQKRNAAEVPGWTCPRCGTDVEAEFDVCWKCLYNPAAC